MTAPAEVTYAPAHPESATTLRTIVDLVRHITHADVISILGFSIADKTVTWKAASGFRTYTVDHTNPRSYPIANLPSQYALEADSVKVLQGIGVRPELPAADFPVHATEGVCDLAVAPLKARGQTLGALVAGYRESHDFTPDEKQLLQDLAAMAALALENVRLVETLGAAEERFRLVVEAAPSAMVMVNEQGHIVLVNTQTEQLFGYTREELLGEPLEVLVPERYRGAHADHRMGYLQTLSTRAMGAGRDLYGRRKDDSEVPIEIGLNPIQTDEGTFVVADIIDITERKKTENALHESEERARRGEKIWEQTFDAIDEGIIVHDSGMRIVRCNARAAELMDLQPAAVIGLRFSEAFALLFGKRAADYYLAESRSPSTAFEVQTECGRRFLVSMFPIHKPDGESVSVVTWNDVTRMSEMQEQLARSRRLASVGQLAAGVAHEINNPLAAITTCAEATMRDMRQTAATRELAESHQWTYYMEEIVRQALRCKDITRGLLDLTRQRKARRALCDVNSLAKQCAKVAVQRAGPTVELAINLDENIGEVATDDAMVGQILDNLFSNAIDALGDNRGNVSLSTTRDGDRIAIEVADTGAGISSNLMSRIFDPFFSTKGPGKGYGLGLAISLAMAESLGGALTVESKEGEGSRFRLWIPRRRPEEESSQK